jgi:DNA-binding GntR family transcriptional regulator
VTEHREILAAAEARDGDAAAAIAAMHVRRTYSDIIERLEQAEADAADKERGE